MPGVADGLSEDKFVEAVCTYLEDSGWEILKRLTTQQQCNDIVAARGGSRLCIEAKGATSARVKSRRFGRPFDSAQVRVNVAEAVYKAVQVLSRSAEYGLRAGIALPSSSLDRRELASVEAVLRGLDVVVFWVLEPG